MHWTQPIDILFQKNEGFMGFLLLTYTKQMLDGERRGIFFNGVVHASANNLLSHTKLKRYKIRRKAS